MKQKDARSRTVEDGERVFSYDQFSHIMGGKVMRLVVLGLAERDRMVTPLARFARAHKSSVRDSLNALMRNGVVACRNENAKRFRVYTLTQLGHRYAREIQVHLRDDEELIRRYEARQDGGDGC